MDADVSQEMSAPAPEEPDLPSAAAEEPDSGEKIILAAAEEPDSGEKIIPAAAEEPDSGEKIVRRSSRLDRRASRSLEEGAHLYAHVYTEPENVKEMRRRNTAGP